MTALFPLTTADVGRPIAHLNSTLLHVDLTEHGRGVLRDLAMAYAKKNPGLPSYEVRFWRKGISMTRTIRPPKR